MKRYSTTHGQPFAEFKLTGLDGLVALLQSLPEKTSQTMEKKVMKQALEIVKNAGIAKAPVGETGNLANGFRISIKKKELNLYCKIKNIAPHAHLVEYGHRMIGHKPLKMQSVSHPFIAEHPFLSPALIDSSPAVIAKINAGLIELMKEVQNS